MKSLVDEVKTIAYHDSRFDGTDEEAVQLFDEVFSSIIRAVTQDSLPLTSTSAPTAAV